MGRPISSVIGATGVPASGPFSLYIETPYANSLVSGDFPPEE
jgi:hypothetical protein